MHCQECEEELPTRPQEAVEDGAIDVVVAHTHNDVEGPYVSETNYYCGPECFIASQTE